MDPQTGAPQAADILIGQTVGNYLVTQKLGEGGMGSVYLAEHPSIGKKVALKVLHQEFSSNPEVAERFFTEAKSVNAIGHPNIVDIVDYGVIQAGAQGKDRLVYFIMEYLSGFTLSQLIRAEAPLPPERALTIALQVADALAASHKTGIVHRDLKPDNIILIQRGRERDFVKLLDFGIAKLTGDSVGSHRTRTGLVLGTPAYMSPEQCEGRANVDHRTDVYALGICLYEMLTGRVPFIGEGYGEILVQHLTQQPVPPSQYRMMSPHVELVVMKALEKRPDMRYPTMEEFMRAMADPVGFVESHGGLQGFMQRQLMPSAAPIPHIKLTPTPMTPVPGMLSPYYGQSPVPTTLGSATGQVQSSRSKLPFMIVGVAVVAVAVAGVMLVLNKKKDDSGTDKGSEVVTSPSGSEGSQGSTTVVGSNGSQGSAVVGSNGSQGSAAVGSNGSQGSAAVGSNGSQGSQGSAQIGSNGSAGSGSQGSATITPVEPTTTKILVTSKPSGAAIFVNDKDTGMVTDSTVEVEKKLGKVTIKLKMKGYDDVKLRDIALDKPSLEEAVTLKKHGGGTGHGSGSNAGSGSGSAGSGSGSAKGSGSGSGGPVKPCDTCLERPD